MLITLTTDFGLRDPFVGIMKGVILGRCPAAAIVDISHAIAPQDIAAASRALALAAPYFPPATIHVAVVDPGVGSDRRIICLQAQGQTFLAPDNGLLSPFMDQAEQIVAVRNEVLFLQPLSATFHGRDIFAPVAAALAAGLPPAELGPPLTTNQLVVTRQQGPSSHDGVLRGHCVQADHFGNMATNISRADLDAFMSSDTPLLVSVAGITISGLRTSYGPATGCAIALINSSDTLEIALSHGNAAQQLGLEPGTPVTVQSDMAC